MSSNGTSFGITAPFENYIKELIAGHDRADSLSSIGSGNDSIASAVESILLESSIATQFDPNGYDSYEKKEKVIRKLELLLDILKRNLVDNSNEDFVTVKTCITFVYNGYALTQTTTDILNKIYSKYE